MEVQGKRVTFCLPSRKLINFVLGNITNTSSCYFCNEIDNVEHYFFYCIETNFGKG